MEHKFTITVHTSASRDAARAAVGRLLNDTDASIWPAVLNPLDQSGEDDAYITLNEDALNSYRVEHPSVDGAFIIEAANESAARDAALPRAEAITRAPIAPETLTIREV